MISEYFKNFEKNFLKKTEKKTKSETKSTKKTTKKSIKKSTKKSASVKIDVDKLKNQLNRIVPSKLKIDAVKPISPDGFSPEGADLIAYNEYCKDIVDIMGGYIPSELIHGTFHIVNELDKKTLPDVLNRITAVKRLNSYSDSISSENQSLIPSFVIAGGTKYSLQDLKNDVTNYYFSKSIEYNCELDILLVLNEGILVKNWREKRSFIGLETKEDTMEWAFILINEYLDVEKNVELDFRKYLKKDVKYNQY